MDIEIKWLYGGGIPGKGEGKLDSPSCAEELENGNILIVDTGNNRVIEIDRTTKCILDELEIHKPYSAHIDSGKGILISHDKGVDLFNSSKERIWHLNIDSPKDAIFYKENSILASDYKGQRIIKVDMNARRIVWEYREDDFKPVKLYATGEQSFGGDFLVANSCSQVFELKEDTKQKVWVYGHKLIEESFQGAVRIPSMAIKTGNNAHPDYQTVLICDGGDSRVIEVNKKKFLLWQLGGGAGWVGDLQTSFIRLPYHLFLTKEGNLLITDKGCNKVYEIKYPPNFYKNSRHFMTAWNFESRDAWTKTGIAEVADYRNIFFQIKNTGPNPIEWRVLGSQSGLETEELTWKSYGDVVRIEERKTKEKRPFEWVILKDETRLNPGDLSYWGTDLACRFLRVEIRNVNKGKKSKCHVWVSCKT